MWRSCRSRSDACNSGHTLFAKVPKLDSSQPDLCAGDNSRCHPTRMYSMTDSAYGRNSMRLFWDNMTVTGFKM